MVMIANVYCSAPGPGLSILHRLRHFIITVILAWYGKHLSVASPTILPLTESCHCSVCNITSVPFSAGLTFLWQPHSFLLHTCFLTAPGVRNDHVTWVGPLRCHGKYAGTEGFGEMFAFLGSDTRGGLVDITPFPLFLTVGHLVKSQMAGLTESPVQILSQRDRCENANQNCSTDFQLSVKLTNIYQWHLRILLFETIQYRWWWYICNDDTVPARKG